MFITLSVDLIAMNYRRFHCNSYWLSNNVLIPNPSKLKCAMLKQKSHIFNPRHLVERLVQNFIWG